MILLNALLGLLVMALSTIAVYLYSYMWFLHEGQASRLYNNNPLAGTALYVCGLMMFALILGTVARSV